MRKHYKPTRKPGWHKRFKIESEKKNSAPHKKRTKRESIFLKQVQR